MFFRERLAERPWPEVLAEWWPRLLPGIAGGATHPVIRVGHAVTAPNAVLRTLPALPPALWRESVGAAWAASAAVVASYTPPGGRATPPSGAPLDPAEMFDRAAEHGDEHVIKMADTLWDLWEADPDDPLPGVAAAGRAVELVTPEG